MSLIPHYVRGDIATIRLICADQESVVDREKRRPELAMIEIDQAHVALSWLISPLQRAEHDYLRRLIVDADWPDDDIDARRAELDAMPVEDALAAVRGWTGEPIAPDKAKGDSVGGYLFDPRRVVVLSAALAAITEESLRAELDFEALDQGLVPPDGWLDEGEEMFASFLLPALGKLQTFYRAAADAQEAILILLG